jgi:soluble P-type ATPase
MLELAWMKPGITLEIPGFGRLELSTLVSDYTGTLSYGGKVSAGVEQRIVRLAELLEIHILTADTLGTVEREMGHLPVSIHRLEAGQQDVQKQRFVETIPPARVAAFGNGNNDRLLLQAVKEAGGLAIAVENGEGCALATLQNATLFITGIENGLDLLIETGRLKATLRF